MLYSIKNIENLNYLNDLVRLQDQVKAVKLQDKLVNRIIIRNQRNCLIL